MHPDVCRFISNQIYEGRLSSHESCAQQDTQFGTGLRWLEARHARRSTESPEEAELVVAQIAAMLGTTWVNQTGDGAARGRGLHGRGALQRPGRPPARDLRRRRGLRDVQVGTVDKFQGREAPVVFFTMTTSSAEDMPRGPEFLFSRNRLNVAVSRARCLAYLVCTEQLLNSRARTIEEMRLIGTLSAFVEYAKRGVTSGQCVGSRASSRGRKWRHDASGDSATSGYPIAETAAGAICNSANGADKVGIPVAGLFGRGINGEIPRWCTSHR